ncbi:MAG: hypothetical protein ACXWVM_34150 [Polyangiales bacterium]
MTVRTLSLFSFFVLISGCAASADPLPAESDVEPADRVEQHWDSQDGNPTHATHSYLAEVAIDAIKGWYPEVETYRAQIVDGANREIHDLVLSDPEQEALRIADGGNNWGCAHPEVVLSRAHARYAAGDKAKAYWYAGIFLHYVGDIGVPAHALHVYHQSSPSDWDHFEVMGLQKWWPLYSTLNRNDPGFADASAYVTWNGEWTKSDFAASFPGVTYTRTLFPLSWVWAGSKYKTFMRERQGRTAMATTWALRSVVTHW